MTYVIAEPCVEVKNGACVEVCPVDCIHTTPDEPQHYIDPDVCIECEQCVLVCPVEAVFLDRDIPPEWERYIDLNAAFFKKSKVAAHPIAAERVTAMLEAAYRKAREIGATISVAIADSEGQVIAQGSMEGAETESAEAAAGKAAVAVSAFREASAELTARAVSVQLIAQAPAAPSGRRIAAPPGTTAIMEGVVLLGAIGVSGGAGEQDQLCARAGLAAYD